MQPVLYATSRVPFRCEYDWSKAKFRPANLHKYVCQHPYSKELYAEEDKFSCYFF